MMDIGFIGAGKVGCSLGRFFKDSGLELTGYYSRQEEKAKEACEFTKSRHYKTIKELVSDSDVIFLTVTDGAISSVFEQIKQFDINGKMICHCSGAMTASEAFPGIDECGALGYSIHPLFPVSSRFEAYKELRDAFFCIEGDSRKIKVWEDTLKNIGVRVRQIDGKNKIKYHAACAIASNLMCALVQESVDLLGVCGFDAREALEALKTLSLNNLSHILSEGPREALTGPVERNDVSTVLKHLNSFDSESEKKMYSELSLKLVDMASKKHPDRDYSDLKNTLSFTIGE